MDGEPLEVHQHGRTTLHDWLRSMTGGYTGEGEQPVQIDVDGVNVPADAWAVTRIGPDSDVKVYPVPNGTGIGELIYYIVIAVLVVYTYLSIPKPGTANDATGNALPLNPAKAN